MHHRRPAPRLSRPKASDQADEDLVRRVREALLDASTPAPLPRRLQERMDELLARADRDR